MPADDSAAAKGTLAGERLLALTAVSERRRLIAGAAGTLVLALTPFEIARGATLLGVRVWPAADYTRVAIEHDTQLGFTHFLLSDPLRLVVDIEG
ncbi:MAG TPA: AMIN domain-containing protein, partial [Burkholderiaceae bacterium]|nr:AMIN domain-containing protein [Burkholderiaceae bacterium]